VAKLNAGTCRSTAAEHHFARRRFTERLVSGKVARRLAARCHRFLQRRVKARWFVIVIAIVAVQLPSLHVLPHVLGHVLGVSRQRTRAFQQDEFGNLFGKTGRVQARDRRAHGVRAQDKWRLLVTPLELLHGLGHVKDGFRQQRRWTVGTLVRRQPVSRKIQCHQFGGGCWLLIVVVVVVCQLRQQTRRELVKTAAIVHPSVQTENSSLRIVGGCC